MTYITHTRYRGKVLHQPEPANIPAKTRLTAVNGYLCLDGKPVCAEACEAQHEHFCRDDDGQGLVRGRLTTAIKARLAERKSRDDAEYQGRWDKVWADKLVCPKYKRGDHADMWLWNHDFYNAPVDDLRYIAKLVGVKGVS